MARNDNYDRYYRDTSSGMGVFWAALTGIVVGAAAVFFSDERNRRRVKATVNDWREKGADKIDDIQDKIEQAKEDVGEKAHDLKQRGLEKVSDELTRTQSRLREERGRTRQRRGNT